MKTFIIFLGIILGVLSTNIYAQGCSDAGFCTVDAFKPNEHYPHKTLQNLFKVGLNIGSADNNIVVFGQYFEYKYLFNNKINLSTKLTALSQSGNETSNFDLSDFYLNGNFSIGEKTTLTTGIKIPLTDGNSKENNISLPMDYQSSLGTFDLILGVGHRFEKFNIALAYQQPLSQNKNQFISSSTSNFYSTNNFKRAGDILLRVSYPIKVSEKLKITPSLLPIYHLANDTYTNTLGQKVTIANSKGTTLNTNAYLDYKLNETSNLQFSVAMPLIVRDVRPDGLTRSFVANLEYSISF